MIGPFTRMMRVVGESKAFDRPLKRLRVGQNVWDALLEMKPYCDIPSGLELIEFEDIPVLFDPNMESDSILKEYEI